MSPRGALDYPKTKAKPISIFCAKLTTKIVFQGRVSPICRQKFHNSICYTWNVAWDKLSVQGYLKWSIHHRTNPIKIISFMYNGNIAWGNLILKLAIIALYSWESFAVWGFSFSISVSYWFKGWTCLLKLTI